MPLGGAFAGWAICFKGKQCHGANHPRTRGASTAGSYLAVSASSSTSATQNVRPLRRQRRASGRERGVSTATAPSIVPMLYAVTSRPNTLPSTAQQREGTSLAPQAHQLTWQDRGQTRTLERRTPKQQSCREARRASGSTAVSETQRQTERGVSRENA